MNVLLQLIQWLFCRFTAKENVINEKDLSLFLREGTGFQNSAWKIIVLLCFVWKLNDEVLKYFI